MNKKYKTFSGAFVGGQKLDNNNTFICKVYADNELVYTSPEIQRSTPKSAFTINVENVSTIRIEVLIYTGNSFYATSHVALVDTELTK